MVVSMHVGRSSVFTQHTAPVFTHEKALTEHDLLHCQQTPGRLRPKRQNRHPYAECDGLCVGQCEWCDVRQAGGGQA